MVSECECTKEAWRISKPERKKLMKRVKLKMNGAELGRWKTKNSHLKASSPDNTGKYCRVCVVDGDVDEMTRDEKRSCTPLDS